MRKKLFELSGLLLLCLCIFGSMTIHAAAKNQTRIHFICVEGNNDAILLESNGHFGMVDSGEDTDYPKGNSTKYPFRAGIVTTRGNEQEVISYLRKVGVKKLDFYIGTHTHSDHIGSGDEILKAFKTDRLYLDKYSDSYISNKNNLWDNRYCYDTLINTAKKRKTQIIQNFSKVSNRKFTLGDMTIEIMNYKHAKNSKGQIKARVDANSFSLGVAVQANGFTAFLAGDINNFAPDYAEDQLSYKVGAVDLLKLGHHGINGSNSTRYLKNLHPDIAIATGKIINMSGTTKDQLNQMDAKLYTTNGQPANTAIIADMTTPGDSIEMISPGNYSIKKKTENKKLSAFYTSKNKLYSRKDTWFYYNQNYYYIASNKSILKNQWKQDEDDWYYLSADGSMVTAPTRIKGIVYSFDASGKLSKGGWTKGVNSWSYALPNGRALTNWKKLGGKWYYFNKSGIMQTGWLKDKGKEYYLKTNGSMVTNSWVTFGGEKYYLKNDGVMLRNTKKKIKGKVYRFNDAGICTNFY